ncbi:hypothetical protein V8C86DRAFT_2837045 [Haematococcus lacustris]
MDLGGRGAGPGRAVLIRTGRAGEGGTWFLGLPNTRGGGLSVVRLGGPLAAHLQLSDWGDSDLSMTYDRLVQLEDVKVPTPAHVLAKLPTSIWTATSTQGQGQGQGQQATTSGSGGPHTHLFTQGPCAVCLMEYEAGDELVHLPCRHVFHKACANNWLAQYSKLCPVCKMAVAE